VPCTLLNVSITYAQQRPNDKLYVQVVVTDACTGAPVDGATVEASAGALTLVFQATGVPGTYHSCGERPGGNIQTITVTADYGASSGSATRAVTLNNQANCPR
jgi:hypothetical protein